MTRSPTDCARLLSGTLALAVFAGCGGVSDPFSASGSAGSSARAGGSSASGSSAGGSSAGGNAATAGGSDAAGVSNGAAAGEARDGADNSAGAGSSGNAGSGAGAANAGNAGSLGEAGSSDGDTCEALLAEADQQLSAARVCDLAANALQCTGTVQNTCKCEVPVQRQDSDETKAYQNTLQLLQKKRCVQACAAFACLPVAHAQCAGSNSSGPGPSTSGTCQANH